jgi:uncharacterized protein
MSDMKPAAVRPCPVCAKPAQAKHRPFCSERCRLIDLGRWLKGDYRIPTQEGPEDEPLADGEE